MLFYDRVSQDDDDDDGFNTMKPTGNNNLNRTCSRGRGKGLETC